MCTLHDFSVLKSNLFIRALLLDRILVTEKTTRTPRVHLVHFYNCELQIIIKTFKNKKVTFSDFYCLINTKSWITNETRCTRGVRVVFSVTRMRSSNSARINKFDFRTEKIV